MTIKRVAFPPSCNLLSVNAGCFLLARGESWQRADLNTDHAAIEIIRSIYYDRSV